MSHSSIPGVIVAGLVATAASCVADPGVPPAQMDETERVFDTSALHEIRIEVAPEYLDALEHDQDQRVPCRFTFDGVTLDDVAIRQKGHGTQSGSLYTKPSFSIRFNELVPGQTLHGLKKLLLNNAGEDRTLLHEHLGFDLYGRAGLPHRRTAHAVVTFVGLDTGPQVYGVHVMVEAVDQQFLARQFGEEVSHGNLFEDEDAGDFAGDPLDMDLKDPEEPGRSYDRLVEFSDFLADVPDDEIIQRIGEFVDLGQTLDSFALDLLAQHADGFWHAAHNYYLYEHPVDRRFTFIPHGMDWLFGPTGACGQVPTSWPTTLGERITQHPVLSHNLDLAIEYLLDQVWDEDRMAARMDTLGTLLETSSHDEQAFLEDVAAFRASLPELRRIVRDVKTVWRNPEKGVCGDAILNGNELCAYACDDGNLLDNDGCSAQCLVEYCGDGVVQPGMGEVCDNEPDCNWDCSGFI